jgi:hypothetical protein
MRKFYHLLPKPNVRVVRTRQDIQEEQKQWLFTKIYLIAAVFAFLTVSYFAKSDEVPTIQESLWLPDCRMTQGEREHQKKGNGSILAVDIACQVGKTFVVYAPRTHEEYEVAYVGTDKVLGDYVALKTGDVRYVFWHTKATVKKWDIIKAWKIVWETNHSWISTGIHLHVEKWQGIHNISMVDGRVNELSGKVCNQRQWWFCATLDQQDIKSKFYFTHYDLGDVKQNDSAPCHGASGVDLCFLARNGVQTMALTADIRKQLWVNFRDKVILEWDEGCRGIYEVHDEMDERFRSWCAKRPGTNYCIKWDVPGKPGGACTVQKVKY